MQKNLILSALLFSSLFITSCDALGTLVEASMWMGAIIVIVIIAVILWLVRKIRR